MALVIRGFFLKAMVHSWAWQHDYSRYSDLLQEQVDGDITTERKKTSIFSVHHFHLFVILNILPLEANQHNSLLPWRQKSTTATTHCPGHKNQQHTALETKINNTLPWTLKSTTHCPGDKKINNCNNTLPWRQKSTTRCPGDKNQQHTALETKINNCNNTLPWTQKSTTRCPGH